MENSNVVQGQFRENRPDNLYDETVIKNVDGYNIPATYGPEGSYIDVADRAKNLVIALVSMSERNRREGFTLAAYTEEYSAPIWENYRWDTEDVVEGASANRDAFQNQLRVSFWRATGFSALRGVLREAPKGSELPPERQVNPRAQKMWRDFNNAYGNPKNTRERNKYKKKLLKQIEPVTSPTPIVQTARQGKSFKKAA